MLLRSILFQLGMWIFTIPFTLLSILTFPASPMHRYKFISLWAKTMLVWLKWTCNITFRIKGQENIPKKPFIILSKHQSAWETLAFQKIFPPQVWVMKRELLFVPFFGWGLAMTSPIAIDRSLGKKSLNQMLEQGLDRIRKGFCIVIFPEGTRIKPKKLVSIISVVPGWHRKLKYLFFLSHIMLDFSGQKILLLKNQESLLFR